MSSTASSSSSSVASSSVALAPLPAGARVVRTEQELINLLEAFVHRVLPNQTGAFRCRSQSPSPFFFRATLGPLDVLASWAQAQVREECWFVDRPFDIRDKIIPRREGRDVGIPMLRLSFEAYLPRNQAVFDSEFFWSQAVRIFDDVSRVRSRRALTIDKLRKVVIIVAIVAISAAIGLMLRKSASSI